MARVSGIISAGLASAIRPEQLQKGNQEATSKAERMAESVRARVSRDAATDQSGRNTDTLGALVGGLGAASVLGGPAGALVFGVTKLLANKRREGIAAYREQAAASSEQYIERTEKALADFESNATTDQEKAAAAMKRNEWEQLRPMMNHPDANVRGQALIAGQALVGTFDDEIDDWQQESIDAEALEEKRRADQFSRFSTLDGKLQAQSARFIGAKETWDKAQLAYERPNPQSDLALVYLTAQMIDPGAIVTDGDSKMIQSTGTLSQQMAGYLNSLIDGTGGFDDTVRDGLMSVIAENYLPMRRDQMERNGNFQELGLEAGLEGTAYQKNLQVSVNPADAQAINKFRQFNPRVAGIPVAEVEGGEVKDASAPAKFAADLVGGIEDFAADVSRRLKGESLVTTNDGRRFVRDAQGEMTELMDHEVFEDDDGNTMRRINHGDGKFEWVPIERAQPNTKQQQRRQTREPGLFQEGGYFDKRRQTNER